MDRSHVIHLLKVAIEMEAHLSELLEEESQYRFSIHMLAKLLDLTPEYKELGGIGA